MEQMGWGHRITLKEASGDTAHTLLMEGTFGGGDTAQQRKKKLRCGWVGGGPSQEIIPLCGSILHAETCQILSLADNSRWSQSVAI